MTTLNERVVAIAAEMIADGEFDDAIERIIVETVRDGKDTGLSRVGFILKMAVELIDASTPPLSFRSAKSMAFSAYTEFRRDNKVSFGDEGWDWSGAGAREVACEYVVQYWETAA